LINNSNKYRNRKSVKETGNAEPLVTGTVRMVFYNALKEITSTIERTYKTDIELEAPSPAAF